jgi:hypothetical protein
MSPSDDSRPSLFRRPAFVVGLNLALLGVLALLVVAGSPANAGSREGAAPRARGEYTMLTGRGGSGSTGLVYILDGVNAELIALRYDSRTHLSVIGYRSMDGDAKATPQR